MSATVIGRVEPRRRGNAVIVGLAPKTIQVHGNISGARGETARDQIFIRHGIVLHLPAAQSGIVLRYATVDNIDDTADGPAAIQQSGRATENFAFLSGSGLSRPRMARPDPRGVTAT